MTTEFFKSLQKQVLPRRKLCCSRPRLSIVAVALLSVSVSSAYAACAGSLAQRLQAGVSTPQALALLQEPASDNESDTESRSGDKTPAITGLWKTVYIADGAVFNVGFNIWHSDGTEWALDSVSPPFQGNTCAGAWEQVGRRTYRTIHPAFNYDPAGLNVVGVFIERVEVTLSENGNRFEGKFAFKNYDFEGKLLAGTVTGTLTGTRINVGDRQIKVPLK